MKKIGREVLFLATNDNIPRNGEGSFIRLNDGRIMFGYTEFYGNDWEDDATANICAVYSSDEGETWTKPEILFKKPEDAWNIMSFSFLRMGNGDIGAFYIVKNADRTDKIVLTRSSDEGKNWTEPINCLDCLEEADYYVINNDRVYRLKNGRIILATARHTVINAPRDFMPGVICFFISDDDGFTWKKTETQLQCPFPSNPDGYEEPGLYELPDGRLWCYIRTSLGFQFECFSEDKGITWTTPEPNLFFSSACSPMHVRDCGDLTAAIFNPVPEHLLRDDSEPWGRTPFVMAFSTDRGASFKKENVFYIEDDLTNGYCYPAIIECADGFLVAYYHSNGTDVCLNSTRITKVTYDEILTLLS
ncbi:MAG: exo-alpha-sialidase [Clostridia bacterium]|nr:exo-alpha-sialidase [Clostridia bacterium]MBQ7044404.1 exo-alpha-sialidase [Clostridia bacterium]